MPDLRHSAMPLRQAAAETGGQACVTMGWLTAWSARRARKTRSETRRRSRRTASLGLAASQLLGEVVGAFTTASDLRDRDDVQCMVDRTFPPRSRPWRRAPVGQCVKTNLDALLAALYVFIDDH
ncbi:hypothetical protein AB0O67_37280, partial [Streptomyces sp. NPDC086077]|uniref:hypothetical protein n=1 Tax=Streptomyces sp. NPDC086077 TaxID=3154862 RepID=UPI00342E3472